MAVNNSNGSDSEETREGLNFYSTETEEKPGDDPGSSARTQSVTSEQSSESETETGSGSGRRVKNKTAGGSGTGAESGGSGGKSGGGGGGILSKLRRAMFGDRTPGEKAKGALSGFFGSGGTFTRMLAKMAAPKVLAGIVLGSGLGVFSILGIFSTYKNDGIARNDPPLECEQGEIDLPPAGSSSDNDIQENVDIMYDIFVNQFGYSEEFLVGMLSCMMVESGADPDRLESDFVLTGAKEAFDAAAGPGMAVDTASGLAAYWTYGVAFQSGGGWNGNSAYFDDAGNMCCGVGLIQWTGNRGASLFEGLDKVSMDVSPMDLHYQCAFLLAEFKTTYTECDTDGSWSSQCGSDEDAVRFFFKTMVSGGSLNNVDQRLAYASECRGYVDAAAANSEFTADTVTMAEILADDAFTSAVQQSNGIQLCKNKTFIDVSDIAKAAVSISWLERGDYEDVHGAYGEYRRSARSPLLINDWDFVDGFDNSGSDQPKIDGTYASHGVSGGNAKASLKYYAGGNNSGKQDLIACTEYYYFAHLIAFPKETGRGGNAGYFSSCDRGTGTAVRIAGADDKFPAGNPLAQLAYAVGAAKAGAKHNTDDRGPQGNGFLWQFAGFLRGCDYYSASGGSEISPGTIMISWSEKAANGYLSGAGSGATSTSDGADSGAIGGGADSPVEMDADDGSDEKMKEANLRWPFSISNTTRHIITFVGEGTVQSFWGLDWLMQQWTLFEDTDRLIRGDLNVEVPEIMKKGSQYKSQTASKAADQKSTFYKADAEGAKDHGDVKQDASTGRNMAFNAKTGLPDFLAWEQIFVRLLHNSDDDAAAMQASGEDELYVKFGKQEDNYLDDADQEDQIEQYQNEDTYADKYFYEDWNSVGAGRYTDSTEEDYNTSLPTNELLYYDDWSDDWTHDKDAASEQYWRYILITDIEYRMNQLMRFGMASFMCSVASEEDADVVQTGDDMSNSAGHILGNLYRRYSRVDDNIDVSGRYYYYNTVVSNDMLQDLVQLYAMDRNAKNESEKEFRNFGPMNLVAKAGINHGWAYDSAASEQGAVSGWIDRRYGLTATDINNIMSGLGGMSMGMQGGDAVSAKLGTFMNTGLHELSDTELALYDRDVQASGTEDGKKSHEGDHKFTSGAYVSELYGVNPFLMVESEENLNYLSDYTAGQPDHSAESGSTLGLRNSIQGTTGLSGVDPDNDKMDDRLAWIDRHYYVTSSGAIGTYAYAVLGLNPSSGTQVDGSESDYEDALKSVETLDATGTYGSGDSDNLNGSRGVVRYTDYIYAEDASDNKDADYSMGNRLFGDDDRAGTDTTRDDYNRREYYVMPYYHTHAALCDHDHDNLTNYDIEGDASAGTTHSNANAWRPNCANWDYGDEASYDADIKMIDTIWKLNEENQAGDKDIGDTISFDPSLAHNREKYFLTDLLVNTDIKYFAYLDGSWQEIIPSDDARDGMHPDGHVLCEPDIKFCGDGCDCVDPSDPDSSCDCEDCPIDDCDLPCGHNHTCEELCTDAPDYDHHHEECDEGDDCHDLYGCNILEYLYHTGTPVFMSIPVVKEPYEEMDLDKFVSEYTSGSKCLTDKGNLLQRITYSESSGFVNTNYQALVDISREGSLVSPYTGGGYNTYVKWLNTHGKDYDYLLSEAGNLTVGYKDGGDDGLIGYFSIEGNLVRTAQGDDSAEEITDHTKNCKASDLQRLEAMKIRVGYGKSISQTVYDGSTVAVRQTGSSTRDGGSGLAQVKYETMKPDDNTDVAEYPGYGEVLVTGSQHLKSPMQDAGNYADHTVHGSGPDGSKGNKWTSDNSLIREILGDEHVVHVTFGSQDPAGLVDPDKDNGRDFMLYVDHKKWNTVIDNNEGEDYEGELREAEYYMEPGNEYDGRPILPVITDDMSADEKRQAYNESWAGTMSPFVDMDGDAKYLDPGTGEPTGKKYLDNLEQTPTDSETDANGQPNERLVELRSTGSGTGIKSNEEGGTMGDPATNGGDSRGSGIDKDGETTTDNGDYRLWVTHASRGTRGMMTQYLNFKSFFKYVHDSNAAAGSGEYAYMLFTNVKRQDGFEHGSQDADGDGDIKEDFVYTTEPSDATLTSDYLKTHGQVWGSGAVEIQDDDGNILGYKPEEFTDGYGQGANSHWKNLIDVYNAAMSETRQFGK